MTWFFIALLTPLAHSIANFIDKIILSKYFKNYSLFVFLIYSAATSIVVLPVFFLLGKFNILEIPFFEILILIAGGFCLAIALFFYLFALYREDTSVIVPFFQLVPVFSFIIGYFILGESITVTQVVGSLIIILGGLTLSFEIEANRKIIFRHYVVAAMVVSSILSALSGILFKLIALNNNFWISNFWESVGFALLGILFFLFKPRDRANFLSSLKTHKHKVVGVVLLSEIITLFGNVTLNYAFLLAPVVLVRIVEGYQPIFVLILGIIITKKAPMFLQEKITSRHLVQKTLAIVIVCLGSYLMLI
jgi:drug/metabolite transporter (DMT)-like permease